MTDIVAKLSAQAKALPPEARARLAQELLASLDPHDPAFAPVRRQRIANALSCLRASRFDLDGSLKVWIGQRR